jgi:DNA-binding XRE family transcriptional regulator
MSLLMDELEWGNRVVMLRHRLRITQHELARRLGVAPNTVPMWETRRLRPYSREAELFVSYEEEMEGVEWEPTGDDQEAANE